MHAPPDALPMSSKNAAGGSRPVLPPALVDALSAATRVVALTGSGVSAESGVPTFRDAQTGVWARFRPEDLATPEAFRADPKRVWDWYAWRRRLVAEARPNPAHVALADLESLVPGFTLITQNVDGLHQRAGSQEPIEFHGNLAVTLCADEMTTVDDWHDDGNAVPTCARCGGLLRPGVVWFGEAIPGDALDRAERACAEAEVLLSIGTSSLVWPAAGLAETALRAGAAVVEINIDNTPLSSLADFRLRGPAGVIVPALVAAVQGRRAEA